MKAIQGLTTYLLVAAGSGLGSLLRHAINMALPVHATWAWPVATFGVNALGSCFIGFFATMTGPDGRWLIRPAVRQGVMIGFCGGLTTFSAFSLEGVLLMYLHDLLEATLYTLVSLVSWLVAAWGGQAIALRLIR